MLAFYQFLLHDDYEPKDNHGNNNQNAIPGCSSFSGLSLGLGSSRDPMTLHQSDLSIASLSLQQQGLSLQQQGLSLQQGQRLNLKLNLTHLDLTDCVRLQDDCLRGILQASAKYGS